MTGGGLILLSGRGEDVRKEFFAPIGRFGIVVTLGLLSYELFGIKKCHSLIEAGKALERDMRWDNGQFIRRPNNVLWVVNEPFAGGLIYPAALAAWTYLALLYENPERGQSLAISVFIVGFVTILLYDWFLRNRDELKARFSKLRSRA